MKNGEVDFAVITTPAEVESGLKMVELKPFYEAVSYTHLDVYKRQRQHWQGQRSGAL